MGWIWLLSASPATHYDLLGEIEEFHLRTLSETHSVWGISWNPRLPSRSFTLRIWNAYGRLIGFQGAWSLSTIIRVVEGLWEAERFKPEGLIWEDKAWAPAVRQWEKRYRIPVLTAEQVPLGSCGLADGSTLETGRRVCLFTQGEGTQEAAYIAELLAIEQYEVYVVGTPKEITPLRSAKGRFPRHIHLCVGLPWLQTEWYALRADVLLSVGQPYSGEPRLRLGRPWVLPHKHPLAHMAAATYHQPEEIPERLWGLDPPQAPISAAELFRQFPFLR